MSLLSARYAVAGSFWACLDRLAATSAAHTQRVHHPCPHLLRPPACAPHPSPTHLLQAAALHEALAVALGMLDSVVVGGFRRAEALALVIGQRERLTVGGRRALRGRAARWGSSRARAELLTGAPPALCMCFTPSHRAGLLRRAASR